MELRVVYVPWAAVSEARAGGVYCRVDDGGAWLTDATPGRLHSSFAGGFLPRSGNERKLVEAALTIEQHSGSMLLDADWVKSQVLVDSEDVSNEATLILRHLNAYDQLPDRVDAQVWMLATSEEHELHLKARQYPKLTSHIGNTCKWLWHNYKVDLFDIGEDVGEHDIARKAARMTYDNILQHIPVGPSLHHLDSKMEWIGKELVAVTTYYSWLESYQHVDLELFTVLLEHRLTKIRPDHVIKEFLGRAVREHGVLPVCTGNLDEWFADVVGQGKWAKYQAGIEEQYLDNYAHMTHALALLDCDEEYMADEFVPTYENFIRAGAKHRQLFTGQALVGMPLATVQAWVAAEPYVTHHPFESIVSWIVHNLLNDDDKQWRLTHTAALTHLPHILEDFERGKLGHTVPADVYREISKNANDYTTFRWCMRQAKHLAKARNVSAPDGRVVRFHNTDLIKYLNHDKLKGNPYTGWKAALASVEQEVTKQVQNLLKRNKPLPSHHLIEKALESHPEVRLMRSTEDLRIEGLDMNHCVAGYASTCLRGGTWILHVGEPAPKGVTVEIEEAGVSEGYVSPREVLCECTYSIALLYHRASTSLR